MSENTWTETGITLRQGFDKLNLPAQGSAFSNAPAMGTQPGASGAITVATCTFVDVTAFIAGKDIPTSFSEMMGLPNGLLDTIYWLPWHNNKELNTQLRFGVP